MKKNFALKIKNLSKKYISNNKKLIIFEDYNLEFEKEKIHCVLGESGSGKSTLMRIIAGLENYEKGDELFLKIDKYIKLKI